MKNKLMLFIVIAGVLTATYRFLPADVQYEVNSQLDKIQHAEIPLPKATADTEHKKHVDNTAAKKQHFSINVASAYVQRMEDVQLQDHGRVIKVLPDDRKGSKHQRFIVRTTEDISVLIAHNIDLAPRVKNIQQGDTVEFYGEYVWNEKGGVVHWTHHDPDGSHVGGWLKHNGVVYQ
ncbi:MAG: DUF3465 domain-containing protein [Cellvibrio sp.]